MKLDNLKAEQLIQQCLGKETRTTSKLITGKHIYLAHKEPFGIYADFHVDHRFKNALSKLTKLRLRWGKEYERQLIHKIFPSVDTHIEPFNEEGVRNILIEMLKGEETIYSPPLVYTRKGMGGRPDLLKRKDSQHSVFGDYFYCVYEVKQVWQIREFHTLQAAFYNLLIGEIQDYTPESFFIIKRNGEMEELHYGDFEKPLSEVLEFVWGIIKKDIEIQPRFGGCSDSEWQEYCNEQALEARNLSVLVNLNQKARDELERRKIRTVDRLAKTSMESLMQVKGIGRKLGARIFHQSQAYMQNKPIVYGDFAPKTLQCADRIFLDFENTGYSHPDVEKFTYLIGYLLQKENRSLEYKYHFARSLYEEEIIFRGFVRLLSMLNDFKIFHWGPHVKNNLKRLFNQYPITEMPFDNLKNRFFDLCTIIKDLVAFPEPSLSLRRIAPFFGFNNRKRDPISEETVVWFYQYFVDGKKENLDKIRIYNRSNCEVLLAVYKWLSDFTFKSID